jgi:hypothetical protein
MKGVIQMSDKFYDFASGQNLQDILASQINEHLDNLKRNCSSLSDELFINSGIRRVISQNKTGRDFLQKLKEVDDIQIPRSTFSDAMHSQRRLDLISQVSSLNYKSLDQELHSNKIDYLREFKEIEGYDVFSTDGHYIEHSSHTQRNSKGKIYASGNLYALNMRNGLIQHFACVSDGSEKHNEMPIFRERIRISSTKKKTIRINDMAFVDYRWWAKQAKKKRNYVISKVKTNSSILYCGDLEFDKNDPVNVGVVSDKLGSFTSSGYSMRIIEYTDPETAEKITFYTTLGKEVRPGVICWLYFLRWQIEKVFDCFKNSFEETKAWATGENATQIMGHFICLAYNFIQFLSEKTKKYESCEDEKSEKKYAKNLQAREEKASEFGRVIHPLIYTSRRTSRISCQFIRSARNHFFSPKPLCLILPIFAERLRQYL